jgi:hypothetical protein
LRPLYLQARPRNKCPYGCNLEGEIQRLWLDAGQCANAEDDPVDAAGADSGRLGDSQVNGFTHQAGLMHG